mgnify:CR=1 FL=1
MKKIYRILFLLVALIGYSSCNYLDIVPDETTTDEDTIISQQKTLSQYKSEAATFTKQLETAQETNDELNKTKEKLNSTEYIEEMAREKLGMYLPNERVYIDMQK